ncbi:threonine/serine dehydratase [Balneolaceae bacterium YR4-1]|uniref:Threonine/serine dehydratase n=1 Tax=Halalkalibaculum roseum TaxID=2709311 RepID=A0A6M1T9L2_9BACT|nr:threonine/serine dehydratase [Halalkalibaculum roseum]NGP76903.1 threonine/serine dehydratase [Halalkalibaculum roseum]
MSSIEFPTTDEIRSARKKLGDKVRHTPVWQWKGDESSRIFGEKTELFLKLELFQYGGSFKPRGALLNMLDLDVEELKRGVTAVSAGNHAIAVAYAAKTVDTSAKVVMPKSANPSRVERCKSYGAEVILVDDVHQAFDKVRQIEEEEGRSFIHPFEGPLTALGTATVGLELCEQVQDMDAVIVPIGGGGLIAGIAAAVKQMQPECKVYGVEPEGADSMSKSFAAGKPEEIDKVDTMADSLGAPHAAPYSFGLAKRFVDEIVKVSDEQMSQTMELMFLEMKLAVEPAGASATAALRYPLHEKLKDKRVGIIVCGSNIDLQTFYDNITKHKQ